jgi:hypothetical protein
VNQLLMDIFEFNGSMWLIAVFIGALLDRAIAEAVSR